MFGRSEEEHNENFHQLMQAAQKHELIFNSDSFTSSAWHSIHMVRVHTDPTRNEKADEWYDFIGIATYISPCIPKHSANTATVGKYDIFAWNSSHDKIFESTKKSIWHEVTLPSSQALTP